MAGLTSGTVLAPRLVDYWLTVVRRTWKGSIVSSFVTPFLSVVALGVLLGGFVEADPGELEGASTYLAFVVPGMLATQAMTTVFGEVTYPVMGMVKWNRTYYSMTATPLTVPDVVLAHLAFVLLRMLVVCTAFVVVMAPFGVFASAWGTVVAVPAQVLVGAAFATPLYAFSAGLEDEGPFSLVFRLGMIPLSLFSGTFFPIALLPDWLEAVARLTPLWHGVDLTRMLTLGTLEAGTAAVHAAYLLVLTAVGWWWSVRRLTRRMVV